MRGSDRGKDFDEQWNKSRRAGKRRQWEGTGPYQADASIRRINQRSPKQPEPGGCKDAAGILLVGLAGGLYWLTDTVVRFVA